MRASILVQSLLLWVPYELSANWTGKAAEDDLVLGSLPLYGRPRGSPRGLTLVAIWGGMNQWMEALCFSNCPSNTDIFLKSNL